MVRHFELLLGWKSAYVCHNIRTEKNNVYVKNQNTKQVIAMQVTFILEIKLQERPFLAKYDLLFQLSRHPFGAPARIRIWIRILRHKNWKRRHFYLMKRPFSTPAMMGRKHTYATA